MTIPVEVMAEMAVLGLTQEQAKAIAGMLSAVETATRNEAETSKEKARARWRKWKDSKRTNVSKRLLTAANVSQQLAGGDARVEDKTSNLEIEPQKEEKKENARSREFASFWAEFPNKVGKPKAEASFIAARKRASFDEIMGGLARYIAAKPADRAWLNPTTFLNQDRWNDQPAVVLPMARASPRRGPEELIDSLVFEMDEVDARYSEKPFGHQAPALRISSR